MNRWSQLVEHAEKQTSKSSRSLESVRQKIAGVEAQRQQMQAYRQEYAARAATPGTVSTIQQLNVIRRFGDQVQLTVSELDTQLDNLRARYAQVREKWREHYSREQALKALQKIDAQRQEQVAERIRRREEDEFSLQARRRKDAGR